MQSENSDSAVSVLEEDGAHRMKQATRGEFFDPTVPYFQDTADDVPLHRQRSPVHPSRRKPSVVDNAKGSHDRAAAAATSKTHAGKTRITANVATGAAALRERQQGTGQTSTVSSTFKAPHTPRDSVKKTMSPAVSEGRAPKAVSAAHSDGSQSQSKGNTEGPPADACQATPAAARAGLAARLQAQDAAVDADVRLIRTAAKPYAAAPASPIAVAVPTSTTARSTSTAGGTALLLQQAASSALVARGEVDGGGQVWGHGRGENFRDDAGQLLDLLEEPGGGWKAPKGGWDRWTEGRVRATEALERRTGDAGFAQFVARAAQLAPPVDEDGELPPAAGDSDGDAAGGGGDGEGWVQVGPGGMIPADMPDSGRAAGGGSGSAAGAVGGEGAGLYSHVGWRPKVGYQPVDTSAVDALRPAGQQELLKIMARHERGRAARAARREAARGRERAGREAKAAAAPFSFTEFVRYQAAIESYLKEAKRRKAFAVA